MRASLGCCCLGCAPLLPRALGGVCSFGVGVISLSSSPVPPPRSKSFERSSLKEAVFRLGVMRKARRHRLRGGDVGPHGGSSEHGRPIDEYSLLPASSVCQIPWTADTGASPRDSGVGAQCPCGDTQGRAVPRGQGQARERGRQPGRAGFPIHAGQTEGRGLYRPGVTRAHIPWSRQDTQVLVA